jgi:hypothetical protein
MPSTSVSPALCKWPTTLEAANVNAAFRVLDDRAEEAVKMRVGLTIAIWFTAARRTTST